MIMWCENWNSPKTKCANFSQQPMIGSQQRSKQQLSVKEYNFFNQSSTSEGNSVSVFISAHSNTGSRMINLSQLR